MINYYRYPSSIGKLYIRIDRERIVGIWIERQKYFPEDFPCEEAEDLEMAVTGTMAGKLKDWLDRYFRGENPSKAGLNLHPQGTAYQKKVWKELMAIPYGRISSYGAIAAAINEKSFLPTSPRAVGGAIGRNPISILIPCHRVVAQDGRMTGYAGGLDRKVALLRLEGILKGDGLICEGDFHPVYPEGK